MTKKDKFTLKGIRNGIPFEFWIYKNELNALWMDFSINYYYTKKETATYSVFVSWVKACINSKINNAIESHKQMSNNKQSSVEYLMDKLFDPSSMVKEQLEWFEKAKAMHNKEHGNTWDASMNNFEVRGMNIVRAWEDFDEYYNEIFGGKK